MQFLYSAFGVGAQPGQLTYGQVALRALLIFFTMLIIVRVADKRFIGKKSAFDVILGFILASLLARTINGSEPLGPSITAGFLLVLLHRGLATLSCRWPALSTLIKGQSQKLIEEGRVQEKTLHRHHLSEDDLWEELRLQGVEKPAEVRLACLERSGVVSVIKRSPE
ncbi:MAG: DUF421 domain-containing protein [Verrucomicrobia bacterium]|nr:DUF421 domain-containing protein [Verrucomicrobiota bacterium]